MENIQFLVFRSSAFSLHSDIIYIYYGMFIIMLVTPQLQLLSIISLGHIRKLSSKNPNLNIDEKMFAISHYRSHNIIIVRLRVLSYSILSSK